MRNGKAHTAAIILAALALFMIAVGALLTSKTRVLPGSDATAAVVPASGLEAAHRIEGYVTVGLTLVVALLAGNPAGWIALAAGILVALVSGIPVAHAILAPIYFSLIIVVALLTSKSWHSPPQPVESPWKPLRVIGIHVAPALILIQIALGAAFRHNAMGVLSHIMNALVVLVVVLIAGIFVLRVFPEHPVLRPAALAFVIITGIQVLLGFSVYMVLLMSSENNMGLIITGVFHVTNAALTLASSVVFSMQLARNLNPRADTGPGYSPSEPQKSQTGL